MLQNTLVLPISCLKMKCCNLHFQDLRCFCKNEKPHNTYFPHHCFIDTQYSQNWRKFQTLLITLHCVIICTWKLNDAKLKTYMVIIGYKKKISKLTDGCESSVAILLSYNASNETRQFRVVGKCLSFCTHTGKQSVFCILYSVCCC